MAMQFLRDRIRSAGWLAAGVLLVFVFLEHVAARQVQNVPSADEVRFQLVGNEPIAAPDNRALVNGLTALMIKDRKTDRCYTIFKSESAIAAQVAAECPR
jgi:hypothetical protein